MSHNETLCRKHEATSPPSLFHDGDFHFQTHHIGFILCGIFSTISTLVSVWLIGKHLRWYTNKQQQRYIVRLLFMVPIYSWISFASFYFWNHATPIVLVRDSYEAIVLTAFFYLLLMYVSDDPDEQKRIFLKKGLSRDADRVATQKGLKIEKWCFPLGFVKQKPADGLYFLQLMKWAVLQYCVIRPATTLAAVILDSLGLYCDESWNPRWGHPYIVVIVSISVTVAMYCLIQLYLVVATELATYKPLLKLFSIKAVVFLTFWQATFLSVLGMVGVIKDTEYMTADDITIGIGAVIETFEMMLFAFLHIRAFTYKPYKEIAIKIARRHRPTTTSRWRSLRHAMDFRETFREIWTGCVYMFDKIRGKEPQPDFEARRIAHYEVAFGRPRVQDTNSVSVKSTEQQRGNRNDDVPHVEIERRVSVEVEGQKQFLDLGRSEGHPCLEKSDGLEDLINHELQKLGYPKLETDLDPISNPPVHSKLPWWRSLYDRLSQSGQEADIAERQRFIHHEFSKQFSHDIGKREQDIENVTTADILPFTLPPHPSKSPEIRDHILIPESKHSRTEKGRDHRRLGHSVQGHSDHFTRSSRSQDRRTGNLYTKSYKGGDTKSANRDPVNHYHQLAVNHPYSNHTSNEFEKPKRSRNKRSSSRQHHQRNQKVGDERRIYVNHDQQGQSQERTQGSRLRSDKLLAPQDAQTPAYEGKSEFNPLQEHMQKQSHLPPHIKSKVRHHRGDIDSPPPVPSKDNADGSSSSNGSPRNYQEVVFSHLEDDTIPFGKNSHRREPALAYSPSPDFRHFPNFDNDRFRHGDET